MHGELARNTEYAILPAAFILQPTSDFYIRKARASDSRAIRKLVIAGGINPTGLDWRRFVVAVSEAGEVIGCGQVKAHRDGSQELASISVAREWRGKGVARTIIERLLEGNSDELYLMCRSGLRGLYEKFGFRAIAVEEMPRYFQKVSQLAGLLEVLRRDGESLTVMKREA